jgi:hypothetical protein
MQDERSPEQQGDDEEVEAHKLPDEEGIRTRTEEDEDEVEAHRMFEGPEEPGTRFTRF